MSKFRLAVNTIIFMMMDRLYRRKIATDERTILFLSDIRAQMGGNFSYVKRYMDDNCDCTIIEDFEPGKNALKSIYELKSLVKKMCTAKYIILEDYYHYTAYKKYNDAQKICQLWHGAGAFKKFAHSRSSAGDDIKIHKGYSMYSKVITSSHSIDWCYQQAFDVPGQNVKATGIPQTDIYFDNNKIADVRERFYYAHPELKNKRIILFAPTYRAASQRNAGYDINKLDLDALKQELSGEYAFIFKWHPAMYENVKKDRRYLLEDNDFFYDFSSHRDIQELLIVSDILITDYSSVIFDYYLLDKPIIFFPWDEEDYAGARGLYYDYETYLYGPKAYDTEELIYAIKDADMCDYKRADFGNMFMSACDGRATKKTCEWLFEDML